MDKVTKAFIREIIITLRHVIKLLNHLIEKIELHNR